MSGLRVTIDETRCAPALVGTNLGLNFGRFDGGRISVQRYACWIPLELLLERLAADYARLVRELEDDDAYEPSKLSEVGYPALREVFLRYPAQFDEVFAFLGRALLGAIFPYTERAGHVINAIDGHARGVDELRVWGRCFRYDGTPPPAPLPSPARGEGGAP